MKQIIAFQGKVVNIVGAPEIQEGEIAWLVEDDYQINVGDSFDHRDSQFDEIHIGIAKMLERHEMALRRISRAFRRMGAAANTAADAEGVPQSVDIPDLTTAQFRELCKTMIP